tara:strand:+ start:121 stop:438 length:318 start_codon:yes stop_codon:yes gene_type:complete
MPTQDQTEMVVLVEDLVVEVVVLTALEINHLNHLQYQLEQSIDMVTGAVMMVYLIVAVVAVVPVVLVQMPDRTHQVVLGAMANHLQDLLDPTLRLDQCLPVGKLL